MGYEVLARKWRPQVFEDVVGQGHVARTLHNAIESGRIAHAYLFVGPRGTGKTSTARIFAKALNCEKGPTALPCGVCGICKEIAAGTSLDVMEIDGASNNGVDQVRELRDTVKFAPTHGRFKIYIIDEVHMLSVAAFNALLKTLEEPPAHVKFIFATTEPDKVLATIISRCQRFDLRRIAVGEIVARLRMISEAEGVKASEDALIAVARGADGGMRDALSALDQLISFKGDEICEEDVLGVFGLVSRAMLDALCTAVLAGDVAKVIALVVELDASGKDLRRLVVELLQHFRDLLVLMHVGDGETGLDVTEAQLASLKQQAGLTDVARVLRISETLVDLEGRLRMALSRRTLLETALIRCSRAATTVTLDEVLRKLKALQAAGVAAPAASAATAAPAAQPAARVAQPVAAATPARAPARPAPAARTAAPAAGAEADPAGTLQRQWGALMAQVGALVMDATASAALKRSSFGGLKENVVHVLLPDATAPELTALQSMRSSAALTSTLKKAAGRAVSFVIAGSPADAADRPVEPEAGGATYEKVLNEPVVKQTLEMFSGKVVEVRE